ncbi:MAG TPA: tripartite tricarboxylate transporter TctB family protein [Methylomirabilota bacterium]|nr:tripartite tricarboxylate transporter TctB family protein [Methylomirabilota bacterium]
MGPVVAPVFGVLLSVGLLLHTRGLDQVVHGQQLGPGFWPRLVLVGLAAACVAKGLTAFGRGQAGRPGGPPGPGLAGPSERPEISRAKLGWGIALIILYVLAAPVLGFALATAGFIVGFLLLCGLRSPLGLAANTLVGTVGLLYLFVKIVYLPLPKGDGPFEAVTLALYRLLRIF